MPWVRFDDNASEDPKIDHLSDGAFRLWFNAICFANRNLTDGFVPWPRVSRLTPHYKAAHLNQLVEAGRFHKEHDGIRIHGYLRYQLSADEITAQRERERERKAKQRQKGMGNSGHDPTTGQFMSHPMSQWDNHRDSHEESGQVSPATHPTPPPSTSSSSSDSRPDEPPFEEEDEAMREARRRLLTTPSDVTNPTAWVQATAKRLRDEGWTPPVATSPPTCDVCKDVALAEPCPECGRSAA